VIALVEQLVKWVEPVFRGWPGYLLVAGGVFADRSAFLGLVVPGDLVLAIGGVYAGRGELSLTLVIVVGALAGLAGESAGFWLGRSYGLRLLRKIPILKRFEGRLQDAEAFFHRNGGKTVFIGRYVSVAGTFLPFTAGLSKMPYMRFLLFDVPSVAIWAVGVSLLGYFLNSQIDTVDKILSRFGWGLLALVVLFFGGRFVYRRWIKKEPRTTSRSSRSSSRSRSSNS
jgi:membrane-associated protein